MAVVSRSRRHKKQKKTKNIIVFQLVFGFKVSKEESSCPLTMSAKQIPETYTVFVNQVPDNQDIQTGKKKKNKLYIPFVSRKIM